MKLLITVYQEKVAKTEVEIQSLEDLSKIRQLKNQVLDRYIDQLILGDILKIEIVRLAEGG